MIQKIKKMWYVVSGALLLAPVSVFANPIATGAGKSNLPTGAGGLTGTFENVMLWILGIFGFLAIIAFVVAGIMYLFSMGNETNVEKAKTAMIYSIVGVVVGLIGLIVVLAISAWLGGSSSF